MVMSLIIGTGNHLMDKRMKNLIVILLLSCSILSAQYNPYNSEPIKHEWKHKEAAITIGANILAIGFDAMGDAYMDEGCKELGHFLNAASVGVLVARPFLSHMNRNEWGWYVASYITMRISIFDPIYNITRDLPIGYIGTTSNWDKGLRKISGPGNWLLGYRCLIFTVAIAIPLNEL